MIGERGINATGNFSLFLQRLNNPTNATAINYDDVVVGAIAAITEHEAYTIDGVSGDIIRFDLAKTSGNYEPAITIYRPDGTRLCGDSTIFDGLTLECTLDVNGTYLVLIGERGINATGNFSLFLQRLNNPTNATAINYDDVVVGAIAAITEHEAYTIDGVSGDIIRFDLAKTSGNYEPAITIYRPDGTRLCGDSTIFDGLTLECTVDVNGTYLVLIGERGINATGNFALYLQRLNNPSNANSIGYGDTVTGSIGAIPEHITYVFNGSSGEMVRFDLAQTAGEYLPALFVYRQNGTLLCSDSTIFSSLTLECTLDLTGTYIILVGDRGIDDTGNFGLSLSLLN